MHKRCILSIHCNKLLLIKKIYINILHLKKNFHCHMIFCKQFLVKQELQRRSSSYFLNYNLISKNCKCQHSEWYNQNSLNNKLFLKKMKIYQYKMIQLKNIPISKHYKHFRYYQCKWNTLNNNLKIFLKINKNTQTLISYQIITSKARRTVYLAITRADQTSSITSFNIKIIYSTTTISSIIKITI